MKDLTKGPVGGHLLELSTFIALTTVRDTLHILAAECHDTDGVP